jgi:BirA family biotin operon repressor/biotin-[acetyl-CoA-carboxylase] ligase
LNVKYIHLTDTASTNSFAQSYTSKCNPNEITVIYTYNQHKGRGQIGRYWFSDSGKNISLSLIYFPKHLQAANSFQLIRDSSLAICNAMEAVFGLKCQLKWPNDLYYLDQKLGGILIQNAISGKNVKSSIIGIGININTTDFPKELPNPISVAQITGKKIDLETTFIAFTNTVCDLLIHGQYSDEDYHNKLYKRGKLQTFENQQGQVFESKIIGVDNNGLLILEHRDGNREKYNFHELKFIFKNT